MDGLVTKSLRFFVSVVVMASHVVTALICHGILWDSNNWYLRGRDFATQPWIPVFGDFYLGIVLLGILIGLSYWANIAKIITARKWLAVFISAILMLISAMGLITIVGMLTLPLWMTP